MTQAVVSSALQGIGDSVEDASEETFVLFSQDLPSNDLGILDDQASSVELEIHGKEYTVCQSSSLLRSSRSGGTTGAMMWKITPRIAEWLSSSDCVLWKHDVIKSSAHVVELGCGVAGLIGSALSPLVATYILTDQNYVVKLLKENLAANTHAATRTKIFRAKKNLSPPSFQSPSNLHFMALDWEQDSAENLQTFLSPGVNFDLLLLCDCIYNTYLVQPLVQTCVDICKMNPSKTTVVLIAQQLRTDEVFETWLSFFLQQFTVWRVKDTSLPSTLQSATGFVVHAALLK